MEEPARIRLLFVDDEVGIRTTLPRILERFGFEVTAAGSVKEALQQISMRPFDILLTDLNIGQPGDGFTVVSAMRRTQPDVATVILTGYPAFETALAAIRSQVDDYVVKPAHPEQLVRLLKEKLHQRHLQPLQTRRIAMVVKEGKAQIIERWLKEVEADPLFAAHPMTREERIDDLPAVLDEVSRLSLAAEKTVLDSAVQSAARHGALRRQRNYSVDLLVREVRFLTRTIALFVQENLLGIEISYLVPDLIAITDTAEYLLEMSVQSFLKA